MESAKTQSTRTAAAWQVSEAKKKAAEKQRAQKQAQKARAAMMAGVLEVPASAPETCAAAELPAEPMTSQDFTAAPGATGRGATSMLLPQANVGTRPSEDPDIGRQSLLEGSSTSTGGATILGMQLQCSSSDATCPGRKGAPGLAVRQDAEGQASLSKGSEVERTAEDPAEAALYAEVEDAEPRDGNEGLQDLSDPDSAVASPLPSGMLALNSAPCDIVAAPGDDGSHAMQVVRASAGT